MTPFDARSCFLGEGAWHRRASSSSGSTCWRGACCRAMPGSVGVADGPHRLGGGLG